MAFGYIPGNAIAFDEIQANFIGKFYALSCCLSKINDHWACINQSICQNGRHFAYNNILKCPLESHKTQASHRLSHRADNIKRFQAKLMCTTCTHNEWNWLSMGFPSFFDMGEKKIDKTFSLKLLLRCCTYINQMRFTWSNGSSLGPNMKLKKKKKEKTIEYIHHRKLYAQSE